jgi:hypothetical protein
MRSFLIAFLVLVLAGVHSAAAFGAGHLETAGMEHAVSVQDDKAVVADVVASSQMSCCKEADKTGSSDETSSCSADCPSFFVASIVYEFSACPTCESLPLLKLAALMPQLEDHPPRLS